MSRDFSFDVRRGSLPRLTAGRRAGSQQPPAASAFRGVPHGVVPSAAPPQQQQAACPCRGAFTDGIVRGDAGQHYVWLALLHYDNDQYRQEEFITDWRLLPTNRLTCWLSKSDIYHCQLFLWSHDEDSFETYSVDAHENRVFRMTTKNFRRGWTFLRIRVNADQERAAHTFLHAQLNKPFNSLGMHTIPFWAYSGGGDAWFCSELTTAALQSMGYLLDERPAALYPSDVGRRVLEAGNIDVMEVSHPIDRTNTRRLVRAELAAPANVDVTSSTIYNFERRR